MYTTHSQLVRNRQKLLRYLRWSIPQSTKKNEEPSFAHSFLISSNQDALFYCLDAIALYFCCLTLHLCSNLLRTHGNLATVKSMRIEKKDTTESLLLFILSSFNVRTAGSFPPFLTYSFRNQNAPPTNYVHSSDIAPSLESTAVTARVLPALGRKEEKEPSTPEPTRHVSLRLKNRLFGCLTLIHK